MRVHLSRRLTAGAPPLSPSMVAQTMASAALPWAAHRPLSWFPVPPYDPMFRLVAAWIAPPLPLHSSSQ